MSAMSAMSGTRLSLTAKVKIGLLLVALIAALMVPYAFGPYLVSVLTLGLVFSLYAMSIDLMGGFGGLVSLGQAGILATAAYGIGYVASLRGGGYAAQLGTAFAAGLLVTAVFALMAMRTSGVYFLMVTLAQGMIVWGLSIRLTSITGAENGLRGLTRPPGIAAYWKYYYFTLFVVALCGGIMVVIVRSPFGLALRGLSESESRLRMLGYNIALQKFYAFMLSGLFATIAGVLYAYYNQFISPSAAAFAISGQGVLMAILGGIGTLIGPVIGAFVIVLIQNVLSVYVERWTTVMGLIFIFVVLFARRGVVGAISDAWQRWLARRRPEEAATRSQAAATEEAVLDSPARGAAAGPPREMVPDRSSTKGTTP